MDPLEATVDKFVFRVERDRRYSDADVWAKREGQRVRIGMTDFLQQRSGDVAFVQLKEVGTVLAPNDQLAEIETIKITLVIPTPIGGRIVSVNNALEAHPEAINNDPYGNGWLAEIEPGDDTAFDVLIEASDYLPRMIERARREGAAGGRGMNGSKPVILIPCSGIGKAYGTVSREAVYTVLENLRPKVTETLCLSRLTLGDPLVQARVRESSVITIDGCPFRCAEVNVQASGQETAFSLRVYDVFRSHRDLRVNSVSDLGENGRTLARILAEEIAVRVDELTGRELPIEAKKGEVE